MVIAMRLNEMQILEFHVIWFKLYQNIIQLFWGRIRRLLKILAFIAKILSLYKFALSINLPALSKTLQVLEETSRNPNRNFWANSLIVRQRWSCNIIVHTLSPLPFQHFRFSIWIGQIRLIAQKLKITVF